MASRLWIGAIPVATVRLEVAPSSNVAFTNPLRLVASGTQIADQPISSISAAASFAFDQGWRSRAKVQSPMGPRLVGGGGGIPGGYVHSLPGAGALRVSNFDVRLVIWDDRGVVSCP